MFNFKESLEVVNTRSITCLVVGGRSKLISVVQGGSRGYYSRRLIVGSSATCERVSVAHRTLSGNRGRNRVRIVLV